MRSYVQLGPAPAGGPQLLQVVCDGVLYRPRFHHVTVGERRVGDRGRRVRGHAHDLFHVVLYRRGTNAFTLAGREVACVPCTLVLTGPGDCHDFGPTRAGEIEYDEVTLDWADPDGRPFRGTWVTLVAAQAGLPTASLKLPQIQQLPDAVQAEAARHIEAILITLEGGAVGAGFTALAELALLLGLLVRLAVADSALPSGTCTEDRVQRVRRHLDLHYRQRLTILDLAALAGMSTGHFHRLFKQRFAESPHAYQQRLRLAAAQVLLRSSSLNCKEIADQVGYDDPVLFARMFRCRFGRSPAAWRRGT